MRFTPMEGQALPPPPSWAAPANPYCRPQPNRFQALSALALASLAQLERWCTSGKIWGFEAANLRGSRRTQPPLRCALRVLASDAPLRGGRERGGAGRTPAPAHATPAR